MATWAIVVLAEINGFPEWNKHASVICISQFAHPLSEDAARFWYCFIDTEEGECGQFTRNLFLLNQLNEFCVAAKVALKGHGA